MRGLRTVGRALEGNMWPSALQLNTAGNHYGMDMSVGARWLRLGGNCSRKDGLVCWAGFQALVTHAQESTPGGD